MNSGTRQGCPLSPLIYVVVADLFNMAIINDPDFKGHETTKGNLVKILAYADDTAVHIGQTLDITRAQRHLGRYSRATGGKTNLTKSKAVLLGSWRE